MRLHISADDDELVYFILMKWIVIIRLRQLHQFKAVKRVKADLLGNSSAFHLTTATCFRVYKHAAFILILMPWSLH